MRDVAVSIVTALVVIAIAALIFEGCDRHSRREQEKKMACIEKADSASEAVLCRGRVTN